MNMDEIAQREAEFLKALPATVSVEGAIITLALPGSFFVIECLGADRFLIGHELPPTAGGVQVRVPTQPRVEINRTELFRRAREWALPNRLAS